VNAYPIRIVEDEGRYPPENPDQFQPFLMNGSSSLSLDLLERSEWSRMAHREGAAWALSQVTAAQILPPLLEVATGVELLNYRVDLRDQVDATVLPPPTALSACKRSSHGLPSWRPSPPRYPPIPFNRADRRY
jgi:hypothetical protein